MPSPSITDDDATPAKPKTPTTPHRNSPTKRTPNGTPKTSPQKASAPNTAPARAKAAGVKKSEPTLLGDFLLGRPTPGRARARRKSLDLVKAEMKMASVSKAQQPGGVKDRVKQWQKASAAAAIEDPLASDEDDQNAAEDVEEKAIEKDPPKAKKDQVRPSRAESKGKEEEMNRHRSKSAPRKRVVSDDHWMDQAARKGKADAKMKAGATLPKNFVEKNPNNPPLEKKIGDWAKRIASETSTELPPPIEKEKRTRRPSKPPLIDDGIRVYASRSPSIDDGIRIKPSNPASPADDGIRVKPSPASSFDDGIRVRPMKEDKRKPDDGHEEARTTPSRRSEKTLRPPEHNTSSRKSLSREAESSGEEEVSRTPSGRRRRSRRKSKSDSPPESLADVPFGNSAFSVLDLPLGADANAMRKPKPQRTGSLSAVPKVLKNLYTEGKKIMHETADPPPSQRGGVNQPPSIESWLNGTSDPFVDRLSPPASIVGPAGQETPAIRAAHKAGVTTAVDSADISSPASISQRRQSQTPKIKNIPDLHSPPVELRSPELQQESISRKLPSQREDTSVATKGLKRTPARRTTSSPRKPPLKEVLVDAFVGESAMYTPKKSPPNTPKASKSADNNESSREMRRDSPHGSLESLRRSPRMPDIARFDRPEGDKSASKRESNKTGRNRLSTIASSETLTTMTSIPETVSELSQTTITQTTSRTGTSYTGTSYTGTSYTGATESNLTRQSSNKSGLKRRLTKHSDLISVLSLPDTAGPTRGKSIRSARSIRTPRNKLSTATVDDLLKELVTDENKYMRELRTLVDGVIPVLLTSVLSRSESAIAAGLFDPTLGEKADNIVTRPIVDMGIALERLRSLHRRIPKQDTKSLIQWAYGAHKVYEDYLTAWRMGFQDVVVNLAPTSPSALISDDLALLEGTPCNKDGDVTDTNGERVDVAFLLKRPLIRIKYLLRLYEGLSGCEELGAQTRELANDVGQKFRASKDRAQRRVSEEAARLEDQAANNIDASMARDPRTLEPLDDVVINRTRQVAAMDEFTLDLYHTTGQSLNCHAEIIMRDRPKEESDVGDLLICETDEVRRWLLFPPIELDHVSIRTEDKKGGIVLMIRGVEQAMEWHELLTLNTEDEDTVTFWASRLSATPVPGPTRLPVQALVDPSMLPRRMPTVKDFEREEFPTRPPSPCESEYPMGTRVKRKSSQQKSHQQFFEQESPASSPGLFSRFQNKFRSSPKNKVVADRTPNVLKREKESAHSRNQSDTIKNYKEHESEHIPTRKPSYDRPSSPDEDLLPTRPKLNGQRRPSTPSRELPYIPKRRSMTPLSPPDTHVKDLFGNSPLKESMRPDDLDLTPKGQHFAVPAAEISPFREDGAPPPPVHRVLSPVSQGSPIQLKQSPKLDPPATKQTTRRSSSPLKHEYQPSLVSEDDTSSEYSSSEESYSSSNCSEDEDESESEFLEHEPLPTPPIPQVQISSLDSMYNLPNGSLAPSNSAFQMPLYPPPQAPEVKALKFVAQIFNWDNKGRWEKLHSDVASVVVTPGQVEVFVMSASHSDPNSNAMEASGTSNLTPDNDTGAERPLLAFDLTPWVPMRKSNATDVDVRSPPLPRSILKPTGHVMFRSINTEECWALYNALNHSRSNNAKYQQLAQEALLNSYGNNAYENAVAGNRRRTWLFGRKKSYRGNTRAPSETNESASSFKSSFSALLRGGNGFNIAKSRIERQEGMASGPGSLYGSSDGATSYGFSPPRTPSSPGSLATANSFNSNNVVNLGSANIKIRLHRFEGRSKWTDLSICHLTISPPPPGRRQASSLNNGVEKHVLITTKPKLVDKSKPELGHNDPVAILDVVLGSRCFRVEGKTGILINIWEDVVVQATGGVSGTTRKWMVQMGTEAERRWVFGLLGNGIL